MNEAEFDKFADEYREMHRANVAITGETPEYFARYKIEALHEIALGNGVEPRTILDFGSGIGNSIQSFARTFQGADLTCADVSQRSLDLAQRRFPGVGRPMRVEHDHLPAPDGAFDLVFSACVFHHIPHDEHLGWLGELRRVTRPGGLLSIFEHNPLNPLTRRAVNTCPFDENAHLIRARQFAAHIAEAGWKRPEIRFHLFFPRALAKLRPFERSLAWCPLGAQYSVTAFRET